MRRAGVARVNPYLRGMLDPRIRIAAEVHKLVASRDAEAIARGPGDPGMVPEGSAAWLVHGDFATMMIGGVAALLMQMLHPAALAGVWDHSNFRKDMAGRLRRTAQFMAATTFGSTTQATDMIGRINRIHDRVQGILPDGTPYAANDPATLAWVHVAGAHSFLRAYVRYRDPLMTGAAQDRYYAETAIIARALGTGAVPETRRDVERYLRMMRPRLRADARSREVVGVILASAPPGPAAPAAALMMQAGIDLLPGWAGDMHGLRVPLLRRPLVRAGAGGIGGVLRWAFADARRRRVAAA